MITEVIKNYLFSGVEPKAPTIGRGEVVLLRQDRTLLQKTWTKNRAKLMDEWLKQWPGQRPWIWWELDAPRSAASPEFAEQRTWLAGYGEIVPAMVHPELNRGVPVNWFEINKEDPPYFESEPAYLLRHNLFETGEQAKLFPMHFEPECLLDIHNFTDEEGNKIERK